MKIVLVNHSDTLGGASVVTFRLMEALRALGHDARMLVTHKAGDSPYVTVAGSSLRRKMCFLAEHALIYAGCGFRRENLFKISIAEAGLPLSRHPLVRQADAVILNWVNQGMLSLKEIGRIKAEKPMLWTMHDMWCMTGVCHHAGACTGFMKSCGHCPLILDGRKAHDMSYTTLRRKSEIQKGGDIRYIAVSRWLAGRARQSSLLGHEKVSVIPNAFPVEMFPAPDRRPEGVKRIVMGAARLDDPIKNLPDAIRALNIVHRQRPEGLEAVFFGDIRCPALLEELEMPYRHLGKVSDTPTLASLYASSKVVLSTSLYETLPGTVIEGMSAGCVAVTTGDGGQRDIVDHLSTGYMARSRDAGDIARGIIMALDADIAPQRLHTEIERKFSARNVALQYIELIKETINDKKSSV